MSRCPGTGGFAALRAVEVVKDVVDDVGCDGRDVDELVRSWRSILARKAVVAVSAL
jgi:urease gamma subunit